MPTPVTHHYFAKDVLAKSNKNIQKSFKDKEKFFSLFVLGFDPFFTYGELPFHEKLGDLCHQNDIDTFFLNYIRIMKEEGFEHNQEVLAALYGHLTHYILDSIMHPFVMYKCGEYEKGKPETYKYVGLHHKMEMHMDAYMYEARESKPYKDFKVHEILPKMEFSKELLMVLNRDYKETFNVNNGGVKYQKATHLVHNGYKYFLEDKRGIKKKIFKVLDKLPFNRGIVLEYLSTHILEVDKNIFNLEHKTWYNPWDNKIKSNKDFLALYDDAIKRGVEVFNATYKYINNQLGEVEYKEILKDYSYVSGLPWRVKREMKYTEF